MDKCPYVVAIRSLMYAQTCTKINISFVVGMLSRYQSNLGMGHWTWVKNVLWYLRGTCKYMLTYKRSSHVEVIRYSDLDFIRCLNTRKSTSRYMFLLSGGTISWRSAKQTLVTPFTFDAKYVACLETAGHTM